MQTYQTTTKTIETRNLFNQPEETFDAFDVKPYIAPADNKNEGSNYDRAVEGGDETFHDYMIERCRDSSFDWDRWDKATGDGYGRHN